MVNNLSGAMMPQRTNLLFVILICVALLPCQIIALKTVPALIWTPQKKDSESATVPIPISPEMLEVNYIEDLKSKNILLFYLDELSVEDFSGYPDIYGNLMGIVDKENSLYVPSLDINKSLEDSLGHQAYHKLKLTPNSSLDVSQMKNDQKNLVVVDLPSSKTNPSRHNALNKSVEVMKNVMDNLKGLEFTFIFTGRSPSVVLKKANRVRISRSLTQAGTGAPDDDPRFHYGDCVLLYLRNDIIVQKSDSSSYTLPTDNVHMRVTDCQEKQNTNSMIVNYKDVSPFQRVKLKINFVRRLRGWSLTDIELSEMLGGKMNSIFLYPRYKMDPIPLRKSYSCSDKWVLRSNGTFRGLGYSIIIPGIQVEAFTKGQKVFSTSFDCVGFFTIPIFTGILTGILLTFILIVGLYMLSDIKTMDRFDDPKGKHFMATGANE